MIKQQTIDKARSEGRSLLTEVESKQLFKEAGINVNETKLAISREDAIAASTALGFPVALKICSPDIIHKSDIGGVKLGLQSPEQVGEAYDSIMKAALGANPQAVIHGVSVQKMAKPGIEVIIGMTRDVQFGPVLMFGLGGFMVEILKDVAFRISPLTKRDADEMVREIKGYNLLKGYRGQEPADVSKLEEILLKVSDFVEQTPEILELDLNPIFAYKDGAMVVDSRIVINKSS